MKRTRGGREVADGDLGGPQPDDRQHDARDGEEDLVGLPEVRTPEAPGPEHLADEEGHGDTHEHEPGEGVLKGGEGAPLPVHGKGEDDEYAFPNASTMVVNRTTKPQKMKVCMTPGNGHCRSFCWLQTTRSSLPIRAPMLSIGSPACRGGAWRGAGGLAG